MRKNMFDEEVILHCDCNDPRCLVHIVFDDDRFIGPEVVFDFMYVYGGFRHRLRRIWDIIKSGRDPVNANVIMMGYENIRELADFVERCLMHEGEKKETIAEKLEGLKS